MESKILGRGWKFPISFGAGCANMVDAEEDIEEGLKILLSTYPGERMMRPAFGCRLRDFAFRSFNEEFVACVCDEIGRAILLHEPRIDVEKILVTKPDEGDAVRIEVVYTIRQINSRRNLVFPFYINEGTDISL